MSIFTRPVLQINLQNLVENYKKLQEIAGSAIAAAVIKDNAYGLGAEIVAETLYNHAGCRHFFVAHAVEGMRIACLLPEAEIFVLQGIGEDSLELFEKYKLIPVIASPEMLQFWKEHAVSGVKPMIQVETGLNSFKRFGKTFVNRLADVFLCFKSSGLRR